MPPRFRPPRSRALTAGKLTECPDSHALVTDTAREAVAVANALGYEIDADERVEAIHALARQGGAVEGVDAPGHRGRTPDRDRRHQRCRGRARPTTSASPAPLNRALTQLIKGWEFARGARDEHPTHLLGRCRLRDRRPDPPDPHRPFPLGQSARAAAGPDDLEAPDVILVSHAAFDHYGDAPAIAKRTGAPVICDAAVRAKLIDDGVHPIRCRRRRGGSWSRSPGLAVRPVECHHWSMATLSDGRRVVGNPIAFIVETEPGVRIYHYGDTCIFDMRLIGELYRPTVGLLGCTLPRELSHLIPGAGTFLTGEMDAGRGSAHRRDARARASRRLSLPRPRRGSRPFRRARSPLRHGGPPSRRRPSRRARRSSSTGDRHWIEGKEN